MESLAILERGYLYPTPGSQNGVESECPFCIGRHIESYKNDDSGVMLQGLDAGRLIRYFKSENPHSEYDLEWCDRPGKRLGYRRDLYLTVPLEIITVPFWLPELSIRNCFIIDELAVWFCTESAVGKRFHWDDSRMVEVARTCWEKRLPVEPTEISKVLLAHGMPEQYQRRAEHLFRFGMETLIAARGRSPLKKFRNEQQSAERLYEIWKSK